MNVKPGDLAFIVRNIDGQNGKIVLVKRAHPTKPEPGWWVCEQKSDVKPYDRTNWRGDVSIHDMCLRPIRPDGITTEEVKELFSPSPAKESEKV